MQAQPLLSTASLYRETLFEDCTHWSVEMVLHGAPHSKFRSASPSFRHSRFARIPSTAHRGTPSHRRPCRLTGAGPSNGRPFSVRFASGGETEYRAKRGAVRLHSGSCSPRHGRERRSSTTRTWLFSSTEILGMDRERRREAALGGARRSVGCILVVEDAGAYCE